MMAYRGTCCGGLRARLAKTAIVDPGRGGRLFGPNMDDPPETSDAGPSEIRRIGAGAMPALALGLAAGPPGREGGSVRFRGRHSDEPRMLVTIAGKAAGKF